MQDIKDVLDAELHTPPAPTFDVATTLGAGRRAVRRRRLAAGGAALALALVVGGAGLAVTSQFAGSQGTDPVQVAAGVSDAGLASTTDLDDVFPIAYDEQTNEVRVQRGWEVVERVEDPVTGLARDDSVERVADSVALTLSKGDVVRWVMIYRFPKQSDRNEHVAGGGGFSDRTSDTDATNLTGWIADQVDQEFRSPQDAS